MIKKTNVDIHALRLKPKAGVPRQEDAALTVGMKILTLAYLQQLLPPVWSIISIEYPLLVTYIAQTFK